MMSLVIKVIFLLAMLADTLYAFAPWDPKPAGTANSHMGHFPTYLSPGEDNQHDSSTGMTSPRAPWVSWTVAACLTLGSVSPVWAVSGGGLDFANLDITGQDFSGGNYRGKDFTQGMCTIASFLLIFLYRQLQASQCTTNLRRPRVQ